MLFARKGSAGRRSTSLMLTLVLVMSMLTFVGTGAASATWAPAYAERLTEPDMTVDGLPNRDQSDPSISRNGRYVVFESDATNLVAGDENDTRDIFWCDLETGETELVSVSTTGTQANMRCEDPVVSGDGRYVAFRTESDNLVPGDTNNDQDIFVRDLVSGETTRVSIATDGTQASGDSQGISITDDGGQVAFRSYASNLVPGDTNSSNDIFVHDMTTGETTRVSVATDGSQASNSCYNVSISGDGRYVAFDSYATNLVSGDTNGWRDIFVRDLVSGETTRVSVATDGTEANGEAEIPAISADGQVVAWRSGASNLVPGDTNGTWDIFVRDMTTGETTRVSVHSDGTQSNSYSHRPSISADGRYVTFYAGATNLVDGDTNYREDVFRHDRDTGTTIRVSVADDDSEGKETSRYGSLTGDVISGDGTRVVFQSWSALVDGDWNARADVFVRDIAASDTIRACQDAQTLDCMAGSSEFARVSADGRYVVFHTFAGNLVPDDSNGDGDVFLFDRQTRDLELISVSTTGTQGNDCSNKPSISADGRYVVFQSRADNLVSNDENDSADIFLRDRTLGTTTRVSTRLAGIAPGDEDGECATWPSIDADGTKVAYRTAADDIVPGDTNDSNDIFVYDIASGETTRASVSSYGDETDACSHWPSLSGNGQSVAFRSGASTLATDYAGGCPPQLFVRNLVSGETTLASRSTSGEVGDGASRWPSMSGDGRLVAFQSASSNLVDDDTNGSADIFVKDLVSGETTRVSIATDGTEGDSCSSNPAISGDGRYVAFRSRATNLVDGDTNDEWDIFVHDMVTGETRRVSVAIDGTQGDDSSDKPSITYDGSQIAFQSYAQNLVKGSETTNEQYESVFVVSMWDVPVVPGVDRIQGDDRYATAIAASVENFDSAPTVVLATGEDFPDALAASGLAGALNSPLLLTRSGALCDGLAAELTRLGTTDVILVGGEYAVTGDVEATLEGLGYTVDRIGGANRYATAALVAERIESELGAGFGADVFVARGDTYPDALAAAPFSYSQGMPILLTRSDQLSGETAAALTSLGIGDAVIIGGTSAVSAGVSTDIAALVSGTVSREAGANRYATAVEVAERGIAEGWGDPWFVGVATGEMFPDAFSGGASCGINGGVLLLTRPQSLPGEVASFLAANADDVLQVQVYGGALAVDVSVAAAIDAIVD